MKFKILSITFCIFLTLGCVSREITYYENGQSAYTHSAFYNETDVLSEIGLNFIDFQGRIFNVSSSGNIYMSSSYVKNLALWACGKAGFNLGFNYFYIIKENCDDECWYETKTSYYDDYARTKTEEFHRYKWFLKIILLNENDLMTWDPNGKYFKVSNYYTQENKDYEESLKEDKSE